MIAGKFITLEGGDGVGKTTHVGVVKDFLEKRGCSVLITREPGGTQTGEKIRDLLLHAQGLTSLSEVLMLFAARAQHLSEVIIPALAAGQWVVCDRFTDASYAYQGAGRELGDEYIGHLEQGLPQPSNPDLTLLFDAPVAVGMQRARQRGNADRFEREGAAFFERVRAGYLKRAERFPERIKIIDAAQSLDAVAATVRSDLGRLF